MIIGYARVSTKDQSTKLQEDALKKEGVDRIYTDKSSGKSTDRPELQRMIDSLREGDTVAIYKLDRLGRSLKDLIDLVETFDSLGVNFKSLNDSIDTSTASGKLTFSIFAAIAEFEASLTRERTMAGLEAAKAQGRTGGRPSKLTNALIAQAINLIDSGHSKIGELAEQYGVDRRTLRRNIDNYKEKQIA